MNSWVAFSIVNNITLAGWLFLLIVPKWKYTIPVIVTLIIFLLAVFYSYLIIPALPQMKPDVFNSLANVRNLFQNDTFLLAGWTHYLAFDLFVGMYITRMCKEINIARWVVTIILPITFLFGPIGYVIFQSIAFIKPGTKQ